MIGVVVAILLLTAGGRSKLQLLRTEVLTGCEGYLDLLKAIRGP